MEIKYAVIVFYLVINFYGLIIMKIDKTKAIHHQYRISERALWGAAFLGGAVGTMLGMQLFRHKTKHLSFKFGFPLLAVIELILFIYFCEAAFLSH